jgi:hypothetical protein
MPPPKLHDGFDSGEVTPWEERAPRFAHECPEPPRNDSPMSPVPTTYDEYEGRGPRDPYANMVIDENDPSLEEFPSEREAILEHVRSCQRRLSEDETTVDGIPPSPVVGPNHNSERHDLPIPSPNMLARHGDRSPTLDSIPEEHGHREELLSELPKAMSPPNSVPDFEGVGNPSDANGTSAKDERETSVEVQEVGAETPPLGVVEPAVGEPEEHTDAEGVTQMPSIPDIEDIKPKEPAPFVDDSVPVDDESPRGIVSPDEGPNIMVSPATPGSSLNTKKSDPFDEPIKVDTAKATAIEEENGRTNLKSRKPPADRPITPTSMRSQGQDAKSKNFLKAYLHLFFVEWIGGLIMRLCGGGRHT